MRPAVVTVALAVALAGCGTDASKRDARTTVVGFYRAIAAKDGGAACAQLTEGARSSLESQEKKPCARAVLELGLSAVRPLSVQVDVTSAFVRTTGGEAVFLDQTDAGWRISDAGCKPMPHQPYDCELEA